MTNYHDPTPRRPPPSLRKPRFKRPLIVLTYRAGRLTDIHSSTPTVQFVRLDVSEPDDSVPETAEFPAPCTARQLSIPPLGQLPSELHLAAQRAFRRS